MRCGFTNVRQKLLVTKIGLRCLSFISRNRLVGLELLQLDPFMKRQLKSLTIKKPRKCVCDSLIWRDGWEKLIVQERFMHTEVNLRIHGPVLLHTGMSGMHLKSSMAMKIPSRYTHFLNGVLTGQEILRIKRSVQAHYNTDVGYVAASAQAGQAQIDTNGVIDEGDPMAALEWNATLSGFVESLTGPVGG
jgi:hypothetical protein